MSVHRELPWFAAFGVLASAMHVVVALTLARFLGMSPLSANAVAFVTALTVSYLGNAVVTFRVAPWNAAQFARFVALSLAGFGLNQLIVYVLTVRGDWPFWASLLVVIAVVPPATFVLAKLWALTPRR